MKHLYFKCLLLCFCPLALFLSSCTKHHDDTTPSQTIIDTIRVVLNRSDAYTLDLSTYMDADDVASIQTQALSFTKSEIVSHLYSFQATSNEGANSSEQVVLCISESDTKQCTHENDTTCVSPEKNRSSDGGQQCAKKGDRHHAHKEDTHLIVICFTIQDQATSVVK